MGINKQVFASNSERKNFYKLSRQWGDRYHIYHNLPFLNLFHTENLIDFSNWDLKRLEIDDLDKNRLKKTSIDYTLCNEKDEPLICIDFDGMCEGFNVGTKYYANFRPDSWREKITELKLTVAHGSFFPYFVVCSKQFEDITKDIQLTIVDTIIGDVLANRAAKDKFAEGFKPEEVGWTQEAFDNLHPSQQGEVVQDWAVDVEMSAEIENNPIYKKISQLSEVVGRHPYKLQFISYPSMENIEDVGQRTKAMETALYHGARCVISSKEYGEVKAEVLLPNFNAPYFRVLGLSDLVAELLALEKLRRLINH